MLLSPKATLFSVDISQAARRHLPQCQTDVHWCANVNLSFAAEDAFLAGQIKSRRTATVISQQDAHSPIILLQISLRLQVVPGMICTLCNYRNKREKAIVNGTMTARLSRGGRNIIMFIWQLNCIFLLAWWRPSISHIKWWSWSRGEKQSPVHFITGSLPSALM